MWKLKQITLILATIAISSNYGAGGPTYGPATIISATQIKMPLLYTMHSESFTRMCFLNKHKKARQPCVCDKCGNTFLQKSDLTRHMRVHTGERPYSCHKCDKPFSDKSNLTRHMRVHTGERPYACIECGKYFSKKESLNRHIRTCKYMPLKQRGITDLEGEFEDPDILEKYLKKRVKIGALLAIGPDVFGETGTAISATKASAASEDFE